MAMNPRIRKLSDELREHQALWKWCFCAEKLGAACIAWHESWFYSPEQERFFSEYERQCNHCCTRLRT